MKTGPGSSGKAKAQLNWACAVRTRAGSFCARNRSVEAVCLPGLESSRPGRGPEGGSARGQRAACPGGGRERELSGGGPGEDGGLLRCVRGAGVRSGRPDRRLDVGRGAERGRAVQEGAV